MREEKFTIGNDLSFDTHFILRSFLRWSFVSLCVACICAVLCFVAADRMKKDVYTASAIITVAVKNNDTSYLSNDKVKQAITRNVDMWNSSVLWKTMKQDNPGVEFSGSLSATSIAEGDLVRLTATAYTARDAFLILSSATQSYRKIYQNFETNYRTVVLTRINENTIKVTKVNTLKYGAIGFLLGLAGCLGLVGLWTLITDILHNETQAENLLDAPVLGALPKVTKAPGRKSLLISKEKLSIRYLESIDMLASKIEQSLRHQDSKILMITSVFENDGKTSVSSNIAITLAKRGRKVLLVDMDLRHPSLYKIFEREKDDSINGFRAMKQHYSFKRYAEPAQGIENLNIIWQFQAVRDSDGFLENSILPAQFKQMRELYDYIILDTPPIGLVRDTEIIAQMADASVLLMRQDITHARAVNDYIDMLSDCGAPCIGTVMNRCRGLSGMRRSLGYRGSKYSHYRRGGRR